MILNNYNDQTSGNGIRVHGYWKTLKSGKKIWVRPYWIEYGEPVQHKPIDMNEIDRLNMIIRTPKEEKLNWSGLWVWIIVIICSLLSAIY